MSQADAVDIEDVFRQRAWHAEAQARQTTDEVAREVFFLVAVTWREMALDAAKRRRAEARRAA
jgi:hypothetical protein